MREPNPDSIFRAVSTAVALVEGEAGVRDVLNVVARLEPVGVRRISRAVELPVPIVAAVCAELRKRGVVDRQRPVRLTRWGRTMFGFDHRTLPSMNVGTFDRGEPDLPADLTKVARKLTRISAEAPAVRVEIDQAHCTVATKLRRVLFLQQAGAMSNRRVLLLGDDDLISITIEHVARHYELGAWIRELAVVDVDPAVLAFCRARLSDAPFPVGFFLHDLRTPLPPALMRRFDTVLTDPPYTPEGAELFLSRAATALSERVGANVFLCFGMKTPRESLRVQSAIADMGFVIRRLIRNFNEYIGAGALGGTSHLYHLTSTTETKALVVNSHAGRLYTGERIPARRYSCTACGAIEQVGADQRNKTVRDLKMRGCPGCGGTAFRPLPKLGAGPRPPRL